MKNKKELEVGDVFFCDYGYSTGKFKVEYRQNNIILCCYEPPVQDFKVLMDLDTYQPDKFIFIPSESSITSQDETKDKIIAAPQGVIARIFGFLGYVKK